MNFTCDERAVESQRSKGNKRNKGKAARERATCAVEAKLEKAQHRHKDVRRGGRKQKNILQYTSMGANWDISAMMQERCPAKL